MERKFVIVSILQLLNLTFDALAHLVDFYIGTNIVELFWGLIVVETLITKKRQGWKIINQNLANGPRRGGRRLSHVDNLLVTLFKRWKFS